MVMSPEEPSFLYATKGGGPKQGTEGGTIGQLWLAFRGQIDMEAVIRMSGRHWTNLIN